MVLKAEKTPQGGGVRGRPPGAGAEPGLLRLRGERSLRRGGRRASRRSAEALEDDLRDLRREREAGPRSVIWSVPFATAASLRSCVSSPARSGARLSS